MSEMQMLIVAGYADVDLAEAEFRALADKVAAKELKSEGMILVGQDADGEPRLMDTGNHLGQWSKEPAAPMSRPGVMCHLPNPPVT